VVLATGNVNNIYGQQSFIQRMAKAGFKNFSPFKILSLSDLLYIGRASKVKWIGPNGEDLYKKEGWDLWIMTFDEKDPYLPLGDVIIKTDRDINEVMCALVKNDSSFSILNDNRDIKRVAGSWKINRQNLSYTSNYGNINDVRYNAYYDIVSSAKNNNSRTYKNTDNLILGDVFSGGNTNGGNDDNNSNKYYRSTYNISQNRIIVTGTSIKGVNTTAESDRITFPFEHRPYAAVNPQYLSLVANFDGLRNVIVSTEEERNDYRGKLQLFPTTPFNTFATGTKDNTLPNGYGYVDLMPEYLVAANCGNSKSHII
jgi:hypothetical protein